MRFSIVSGALTLLSTSLFAFAAPATAPNAAVAPASNSTAGLPLGVAPYHAPPPGVTVYNATAGYNATHGLPYDKNAHGPLTRRDMAKRQAYSGDATWFYPGLGACGGFNYEWEYVVALDQPLWNGGANCWRGITIQAYGKQVNAAIVDLASILLGDQLHMLTNDMQCPGCAYGSLDLAPALFQQFTGLDTGRFGITWWYR